MTKEAILEATVFLQDNVELLTKEIIVEMAEAGPDGRPTIIGGELEGIRDKLDRILLIGEIGSIMFTVREPEEE